MELKALLLTLLVGVFFLIGIIIPKFFKNKNKLTLVTTSFTFIIMLFLILFDLIPDVISLFDNIKYLFLVLIFVIFGICLLKYLDYFIPEHTHHHSDSETNVNEHNSHLFHIGLITAISLIIHNVLEGISIYITGLNDFKLGLLMSISVGCHNLPLGIEVGLNMDGKKNNKLIKIISLTLLVLSSFLGAALMYLINIDLSNIVEGILLSITIGMLIYIAIFELLHEIIENKNKLEIKLGIIIGLIFSLILFIV